MHLLWKFPVMPGFDFNQWVFWGASAIVLVAGLSWQVRVQRRRQKLVNQELSRLHCSQCGGTFEPLARGDESDGVHAVG